MKVDLISVGADNNCLENRHFVIKWRNFELDCWGLLEVCKEDDFEVDIMVH